MIHHYNKIKYYNMDVSLYDEFIKELEGSDFGIEKYTDIISIRRIKGEYKAIYFSCNKSDFTIDGVIHTVNKDLRNPSVIQSIYMNYSPEIAEYIFRSSDEIITIIEKVIRRTKIRNILN
jgi:hypothetical protein